MVKFAQQKGLLNFLNLANNKFAIPNDLKCAKKEIDQCIAIGIDKVSNGLKIETLKELRHDYFHFSAHYESIPKHPQFSEGGPEYGERKRIIQDG
jgi:hypothetical protein